MKMSEQKNAMKKQDPMYKSLKPLTNVFATAMLIVSLVAYPCFATPPTITQSVTPGTVSYQGHVQDADGTAYTDGVYGIDFRLYDAPSAGTLLWGVCYKPYLKGGFFNVILGQTSVGETALTAPPPLYPAVEDFWKAVWLDPNNPNKTRYLSLTIVEERDTPVVDPQESFPRQQLLASPYSVQAQFAQQADSASRSLGDFTVTTNLSVGAAVSVAGKVTAGSFAGFGSVPIGGIIMWSGTTPPDGWRLCDGTKIGNITTPDLQGRFVLAAGTGDGLTPRRLGDKEGTETQALKVDELPAHKHENTASSSEAGAHTHTYHSGWGSDRGIASGKWSTDEIGWTRHENTTSTNGNHTHTITMQNASTGAGLPHNNMPPYYVLAFIMRVE